MTVLRTLVSKEEVKVDESTNIFLTRGDCMTMIVSSLQGAFQTWRPHKATRIMGESSHPSHSLLTLTLSGKRYRSISVRNARLLNSFFSTRAVRILTILTQKQRTPISPISVLDIHIALNALYSLLFLCYFILFFYSTMCF